MDRKQKNMVLYIDIGMYRYKCSKTRIAKETNGKRIARRLENHPTHRTQREQERGKVKVPILACKSAYFAMQNRHF